MRGDEDEKEGQRGGGLTDKSRRQMGRNRVKVKGESERWRKGGEGGNKRGGKGKAEERITRDERSREERIIGGRDERAESKGVQQIERQERRGESDRQADRQRERWQGAAVQGQANLNFNSLCARGRSGRQFTT